MIRLYKSLVLILTLNCEQSAKLMSDSFDRDLSWSERWALRLHCMVCRRSREMARQLKALHQSFLEYRDRIDIDECAEQLSPDARDRIRQRLKNLKVE